MTDETKPDSMEEIDANMNMPEPGVQVEQQEPPIPGAESTDETEDAAAGDSSEDSGDGTDTEEVELPGYVEHDHLRYLDALQESGDINMEGASPYLAQTFDITRGTAKLVLEYWKEQK